MAFCVASGKPWLLLLPNFVYMKDWYGPALRGGGTYKLLMPAGKVRRRKCLLGLVLLTIGNSCCI